MTIQPSSTSGKLLLEASGHQVETAETLPRRLEKLAVVEPDVLVMDLRLPELKDGLDLDPCLRAERGPRSSCFPAGRRTWILPEEKLVHRVLGKPVRPNTLLRHIAELVLGICACYGIFLARCNPPPACR